MARRQRLPTGFGEAKGRLLTKLVESGVAEATIPHILSLDEDEATKDMTLVELGEHWFGITQLCDKARDNLLDKVEQSLANLALGGVMTERRWVEGELKGRGRGKKKTREPGHWEPVKQKDVAPHFESIRKILSRFRPDEWGDNRDPEDTEAKRGVAGARRIDQDIKKLEQFAGQLLEKCSQRHSIESGVSQEPHQRSLPEPGDEEEFSVDAEPEPALSVQHPVLDVQPESTDGQEKPAVHNVADAGQSDTGSKGWY